MGYVYFEADPSQFGKIHIELFSSVALIDGKRELCNSGILIQSTDNGSNQIVTDLFPYGGYNDQFANLNGISYPVTSNGAVAAAGFIIGDIRIPNGDQQIYFPEKGADKDGQVELCVHISTKLDYDNILIEEYVGYVDQLFIFEIDWTVNTAMFSNIDVIKKDESLLLMMLYVNATITVQSYVCDDTNTIIDEPLFSLGQYFCICVGPEYDEDINYSVSGFKSMICSNNGKSRNLVRNYITDPLTDIDDGADGNGIHAIQSMVIKALWTMVIQSLLVKV